MLGGGHSWQEELDIVDRTMRAISGIRDPEELVSAYWNGIGDLIPIGDYVSMSRRYVEPPYYLITRSSRFTEHPNPWKERHKLPKLTGGLLGEIAFGNKPVIIDDLPARLTPDDPAHFYLQGFGGLVALPQYDAGEGLNVTVMLTPPGELLTRGMIPILHWQTGLFGRGTQNLVLRNQLDEALARLDDELRAVGRIQRSLLPQRRPTIPGFELAADYTTSARAGGDYYDFFPLDDGGWGLFIADVSGHGTPAAVMMAITHAIAHSQPGTHTPPAALLTHLNNQLTRSYTRGGTFVTAFYGVLDPATGLLTYANAGHNPPRLARASEGGRGSIESIDQAGSIPLGILPEQNYQQAEARMAPGDMLLLYTDGITEAMAPRSGGPEGGKGSLELFGVERLDRTLAEASAGSAGACIDRIRTAVDAFTGHASATDDRTLIALKRG